MKFYRGDNVRWTDGGETLVGEIFAEIPAGIAPATLGIRGRNMAEARDHVSYVTRRFADDGPVTRMHWPEVTNITLNE